MPREFRPKDIDGIRKEINATNWEDKERYLHLMELVENNPTYWLDFGS